MRLLRVVNVCLCVLLASGCGAVQEKLVEYVGEHPLKEIPKPEPTPEPPKFVIGNWDQVETSDVTRLRLEIKEFEIAVKLDCLLPDGSFIRDPDTSSSSITTSEGATTLNMLPSIFLDEQLTIRTEDGFGYCEKTLPMGFYDFKDIGNDRVEITKRMDKTGIGIFQRVL
jgi:hypothetical protein